MTLPQLPHRLLAALLLTLFLPTLSLAGGPAPVGRGNLQPALAGGKAEEKRFTLEMHNRPWKSVFEWLADQATLPIVASSLPTGTFTFIPGSKKQQYTLPEVIDLLNEALLSSKFLLVRRDNSLVLVAADERLDPRLCPLVTPKELAQRGRTEMVRILLPLKSLEPREALAVVKSMLGPFGEVLPLGKSLLLRETAGNVRQIIEVLGKLEPETEPGLVEVIPLTALDAGRTAEMIRAIQSGKGGKAGGVAVEADTVRNILIVRGSREQINEVRAFLVQLGEGAGGQRGNLRIIPIERESAATLAEELGRLLKQMRGNPVQVIVPGGAGTPAPKPPAKDPAEKKQAGKPPVTITAAGNKLVISSEDPEVLALAQELVRLLTAPGVSNLEVMRLRHADARSAAKILDELFNGPMASGPAAKRPERVRVVVDAGNNALIIKASPLDLLTVRQLLAKSLDVERDDPGEVLQVRIVGPLRNINAADVVKIVQELYQHLPKGRLAVSAETRTNSLVLRCSLVLLEEIQALVTRLEAQAEQKK